MTPFLIRPTTPDDIPALLALTGSVGSGMTTLPRSQTTLEERVAASIAAFAGTGIARAKDIFFLVLEDEEGPVGMASIFPNLGEDRPFYSYRVSHIDAQAPETGLRASTDILQLVNDFHGYTEIGTLLVGERARGRGVGRFLSLSRFLFMGREKDRFGSDVMADIRGWLDADGHSPFWDHIPAKFFHTSFDEADRLSAHDFRFISHLMPKFPIYVSLLPDQVQEAIGKPHEKSAYALNMLMAEGFRYTRCVDIFDGGPSIECTLDSVRTVKALSARTATISDSDTHIAGAETLMVTSSKAKPFVAILGTGHIDGHTVVISPQMAERAGFSNGEQVLASPLKG